MAVPIVTRKPWALVALILNCIPLPGFVGAGTLIAAANQEDTKLLRTGLIQFILGFTFLLTAVAWIWSVVVGVQVFLRSEPAEVDPEAMRIAEEKKAAAAKKREEAKAAKEAQKAAKAEAKAKPKDKPKKDKSKNKKAKPADAADASEPAVEAPLEQ